MKKINLNDTIKVKLTDRGRDIYYHQFDDLIRNRPAVRINIKRSYPKVDDDGFTKLQLHHFMNIYGDYLILGSEPVVEGNNIYFEDDDLKECCLNI